MNKKYPLTPSKFKEMYPEHAVVGNDVAKILDHFDYYEEEGNHEVSEYDPDGIDIHDKGAKVDGGKPKILRHFIAMFPRAMRKVAEVSAHGEEKYTYGGWRYVNNGVDRYKEALVRHLISIEEDEYNDMDSDLSHYAHLAWNAMAVLELLEYEEEQNLMEWKDMVERDM